MKGVLEVLVLAAIGIIALCWIVHAACLRLEFGRPFF